MSGEQGTLACLQSQGPILCQHILFAVTRFLLMWVALHVRHVAAAGVGSGSAAAVEAAVDGVAQALQAAAIQVSPCWHPQQSWGPLHHPTKAHWWATGWCACVSTQAGTAALSALVRSCSASAAAVLTACPAAVRALVLVATGGIEPAAQYKLVGPLQVHVTKLMQHACREACDTVAALALAPMPAPRVLQPYAGKLSAAALQRPGSLVTAVERFAQM
jgi:hypothetical protein